MAEEACLEIHSSLAIVFESKEDAYQLLTAHLGPPIRTGVRGQCCIEQLPEPVQILGTWALEDVTDEAVHHVNVNHFKYAG